MYITEARSLIVINNVKLVSILCCRYRERKAKGKIKTIRQLPPREQRQLRRDWRRIQRRRKEIADEKAAADAVAAATDDASISTPNGASTSTPNGASTSMPNGASTPTSDASESRQKAAGRRKIRRENRQAYRTIVKQNKTILALKAQLQNVKRRHAHFVVKSQCQCSNIVVKSPGSKVKALMSSGNKQAIRRQLMFGFALSAQLAANVKEHSQSRHKKEVLRRILMGAIMRKYRLTRQVITALTLTRGSHCKVKTTTDLLTKQSRMTSVRRAYISERVTAFYHQDISSTITAGKRETVTMSKVKKQRRYLCDTVANLHSRFLGLNPNIKISYSYFANLRPFYVMPPRLANRNTVQCKLHANCELQAKKLHQLGVLPHRSVNDIISVAVCTMSKACMYGECIVCANKLDNMYSSGKRPTAQTEVTYSEWKTIKEQRINTKGKEIEVTIQAKRDVTDTLVNLCKSFEKGMRLLLPHQYRILHQYKAIRSLKDKLAAHECVLQVDFSENYACKASTEIQAMHFGASRRQITLHTCHATLKDLNTQCYCTVSEDLRHELAAIWAHLLPVLRDLRKKDITCIHFLSDGPATQYKNRRNFAMLSSIPFEMGFQKVFWNFLEASHGKGPADGVGAAIKNAADRSVAHGNDVLNISQLCATAHDVNVTVTQVTSRDVDDFSECIPDLDQLVPIKGSMQIHQIICLKAGFIKHRVLSCYCSDVSCECYQPTAVRMPVQSFPDGLLTHHSESIMIERQADDRTESVDNDSTTPLLHHYYAVYFTQRSKGTFYVGRLTNRKNDELHFKFLERVGNRSAHLFDWPKREDLATVNPMFIMNEVTFDGPPPFSLDGLQLKDTLDRVQAMSIANASSNS